MPLQKIAPSASPGVSVICPTVCARAHVFVFLSLSNSVLSLTLTDTHTGWDYFLENVLDPAHVSVSHHGITGNRYTSPSFYDLITERELTAEGGFKQRVVPDKEPETGMGAGAVSFHDFRPPSLVHISQEYSANGGKFVLALYACPTRPGWVRHIGCQVRRFVCVCARARVCACVCAARLHTPP